MLMLGCLCLGLLEGCKAALVDNWVHQMKEQKATPLQSHVNKWGLKVWQQGSQGVTRAV